MDIKKEYERWLTKATADADVAAELKTLNDAKSKMRFTVTLPLARAVCAASSAQAPTA